MKAALAEQSEKKPAAAGRAGWYALSASLIVAHENPHLLVTRRIPYGSCRVFVAVGRRLRVTQGRREWLCIFCLVWLESIGRPASRDDSTANCGRAVAGDDRTLGAEHVEQAVHGATPVVVDVLKRFPAAPGGGGRVGELIRMLDAVLRH